MHKIMRIITRAKRGYINALMPSESVHYNDILYKSLKDADSEIYNLIQDEENRQRCGLELIASENFTSVAVMEANGSILTNKYSEGLPGARYYGGNEIIDKVERLCQDRALKLYGLDPLVWGVNVQPYSGSTANFAALTGILSPQDRIMGLDLPSGGHLTHGYQTAKKKISASSIYFQSFPYKLDSNTGFVDYEKLAEDAKVFHPKLVICGGSAYPREWNYKRLREIASENHAYLMADMAHISGLVATKEADSPFDWCDIVTTTTHKTLRGPRAGLIFFRRKSTDNAIDLEEKINFAVFPGCQGGPHENTIAAIAVALKQAATPEFKEYCFNIRSNAEALCNRLKSYGYKLVTDGTDNHLILWDLRPQKLTGSKMENICDMIGITINKNSIQGDVSAITPGGVRLGTPALTSRGFKENDFKRVADYLHQVVCMAMEIQNKLTTNTLKDFMEACRKDPRLSTMRDEIREYSKDFPLPVIKK